MCSLVKSRLRGRQRQDNSSSPSALIIFLIWIGNEKMIFTMVEMMVLTIVSGQFDTHQTKMSVQFSGPEANSHHDKFPPWWESVRDDDGGNLSVTKSHHWRWWWWLWLIICKKCARTPPVFLQICPRERNSSHCFGHPVTRQIFVTFWEWTGSIS